MPKDAIRDGMNFALGLIKISGDNFNKAVKKLENSKKLSSSEGEKMVYAWLASQQRQLETMRKKMKKKVLKTRLYSSNDLAEMNRVIQGLSRQITILENKKRKAEKPGKKKKAKKKK
jgi:polyhydroxyalkanoate synthesis regulator phasin